MVKPSAEQTQAGNEPAAPAAVKAAIAAVQQRLGDRLSINPAVRDQHGHDESYHRTMAPDAVAFAHSTEEVAEIARICHAHGVPMIAVGTATGLEGGTVAVNGGIAIDLTGMNRILDVSSEDMDCRIQAGVTRKHLNDHLRDTGLFFPVDPGADASIGGMAATGASGTNAVRYGTMAGNVLGLTVVLADGRIIRTGGRARKSASGYDLTRLMVGSEGTLGIITEVTLRLHGIPESIASAVCSFPTVGDAVRCVVSVIQAGIPVARAEFLDSLQVEAVNRYSKLNYPVQPTLFFEFHGSAAGVKEQSEAAGLIAEDHGGSDFQWAVKPEDRSRLWQARHDAYYACLALRPGSKGYVTDVCVPISRLAEAVVHAAEERDRQGITAPIVGHVGDGNFHLCMLVDPDSADEMARADALNRAIVEEALAAGGTATGEHGVGQGKRRYMAAEHGEAVAVMRAVKAALDPSGLLNPGKVLPAVDTAATS